jgi:serine/threonine protein kinase
LGCGQFGRVYLVKDIKNYFALKVIAKKRFMEREWEAWKKLKGKSRYIVELFQRYETKDYVFILMEYCNCGCLTDILKLKLSEQICNNIIFQIC